MVDQKTFFDSENFWGRRYSSESLIAYRGFPFDFAAIFANGFEEEILCKVMSTMVILRVTQKTVLCAYLLELSIIPMELFDKRDYINALRGYAITPPYGYVFSVTETLLSTITSVFKEAYTDTGAKLTFTNLSNTPANARCDWNFI